jgi:hypothetical protein
MSQRWTEDETFVNIDILEDSFSSRCERNEVLVCFENEAAYRPFCGLDSLCLLKGRLELEEQYNTN